MSKTQLTETADVSVWLQLLVCLSTGSVLGHLTVKQQKSFHFWYKLK